jgi:hypothetical protein
MASSVRPRPNYYDMLGLSPAATQDDIGRAFAKGMGLFGAHPAAAAAQLSIAFETLRDPARRRAYDSALGLRREPEPRQWTMTVPGRTTRGFVASAPEPTEKAASDTLARLQRLAEPQPLTRPAPKMEAPRVPERQAAAAESEDMPLIEWKRPALTVGALFVAAGLIGALAGSSLLDPQQAQQAPSGRTFGRPAAKVAAPPPVAAADAPVVAEAAAAPRLTHDRSPKRPHPAPAPAPQQPEDSLPAEGQVADAAPVADAGIDVAAAPSATAETVAAAGLPLAAKVMERTIERIGYACGSVASATPAEGEAAGVYKVTCTSGDTYRAAPVGGRYRFRRWSRH